MVIHGLEAEREGSRNKSRARGKNGRGYKKENERGTAADREGRISISSEEKQTNNSKSGSRRARNQTGKRVGHHSEGKSFRKGAKAGTGAREKKKTEWDPRLSCRDDTNKKGETTCNFTCRGQGKRSDASI